MEQVTLTINFEVENSAFRDIDGDVSIHAVERQIERTTRDIRTHLNEQPEAGTHTFKIRDINGNGIGQATLTIPESLPKY